MMPDTAHNFCFSIDDDLTEFPLIAAAHKEREDGKEGEASDLKDWDMNQKDD